MSSNFSYQARQGTTAQIRNRAQIRNGSSETPESQTPGVLGVNPNAPGV